MFRFLALLLLPCPVFSQLVINEVDYDQVGVDTAEFIELKNTGVNPIDLQGYKIELVNGSGGAVYHTIALPGFLLQPGAYYVICGNAATVSNCNLDDGPDTDFIQNGSPDAIGLRDPSNHLIDALSYEGSVPGYVEGTGTSAADSNSIANIGLSRTAGVDTNDNSADFSIRCITPGAKNSSEASDCPAPSAQPSVTTASPLPNGILNIAYSISLQATGGTGTFTNWAVTAGALPAGLVLNPLTGEIAGIPIAAGGFNFTATVTDSANISGSKALEVTIDSTPATCLATHTIAQVQGSGQISPLVSNINQNGALVTAEGIVTAVLSNGFFLQSETGDGDPATSEGVFVFTSAAPPAAAVRKNKVCVTGPAFEFRPATEPHYLSITEINLPTSILRTGTVANLPVAVVLTAADPDPDGAFDQLEKYEGMRVSVPSMTVVGATLGAVSEQNAASSLNGEFFGVVSGVPRPFREPGIEQPEPLPPDAPDTVPVWNGNPERIFVDSNRQAGARLLDVNVGYTVSNVTGPLHYDERTYEIFPDPDAGIVVTGSLAATPVPDPEAAEFTIASFNLERFFDTANDPRTSDPVLTAAAFANRLNKASLAIRDVMKSPDVLAVQEVENLATLQSLAGQIGSDYQAFLLEGNDIGGIDTGFLVKTARVTVLGVTQIGKDETYIDPNTNQPDTLNDRPPLVLQAAVNGAAFTVIVVHQRSLLGIDNPTGGNRVRTKRRAQAEFLANYIQSRQQANPSERIAVLGDFNAFEVNDGYVDVTGTIKGQPAPAALVTLPSDDLVDPDLTSLADIYLPTSQRYSYVFRGNAQTIDHILANPNMLSIASRFAFARNNADFSESFRNDPNRPERLSDHDMPVAYFRAPGTALSISSAITARVNGSQPDSRDYTLRLKNRGASDVSGCTLNSVSFRLRSGSGTFTLLSRLPMSFGALTANGGKASRTLTVVSPPSIERFTMKLTGNCGASPFTASVRTLR
ncbi:MAG TPA: lamin tail domain-containing protein [Bryobacteraceae bacterium]|nr:lamin tail domain-containing protein [Bryobacteraceae bacterium]